VPETSPSVITTALCHSTGAASAALSCQYLHSADYAADPTAAQAIWSSSAVPETAGAFIFLTYLTLLTLTAVRTASGPRCMAHSVLDGQAERLFLLRLLGLADDPAWGGGIRNQHVRKMAATVVGRHLGFSGMRHEYLDLIAALVALVPLRVRSYWGYATGDGERARYWRYITHEMSLMHAQLAGEEQADQASVGFVKRTSGLIVDCEAMIRSFADRHPVHVRRALPILHNPSRSLILPVIGESDA
jgi:hypothetical protein